MMNEFKSYHPIVNFLYFVIVIGFSMFFMHPLCLAVSFACGLVYSTILNGRRAVKTNLVYMLPVLIITALINPAFNHEGVTILTYLPGGNSLTLESILYGLAAGFMLVSVICWFSCYNEVMTSDKFIYLFGRIIPSLSLIFSMTLRLVPKFATQLKIVTNAQRCIGRDISSGSVIKRAKSGVAILSVMITWLLESSIETADSMKSRGYGLPGRTAYSIFSFSKRDALALTVIAFLGVYILFSGTVGGMYFRYFPAVETNAMSVYSLSVFASYFLLCIFPVGIEMWEAHKWNVLKSKI